MSKILIGVFMLVCVIFNEKAEDVRECRQKNRLIGNNETEEFHLVDSVQGQTLILECHYCGEEDDKVSKVWYQKINLLSEVIAEVPLGMSSNTSLNRISVTTDHSLVIQNITTEDSTMYFCHTKEGAEKEYKYNYYIDVLTPVRNPIIIVGNLTDWSRYQSEWLQPANYIMLSSDKSGTKSWTKTNLKFHVFTEWQNWGPCVSCYRAKGLRKRIGKCRIKTSQRDVGTEVAKDVPTGLKMLLKLSIVYCRSEIIQHLGREIFGLPVWMIPDFVQTEECEGKCLKNTKQELVQYKVVIPKIFINLQAGTDKFLTCPGATPVSVISWKKDKHIFDKSYNSKDLRIDDLGTLWFHSATRKLSGNYTCFIDGKKIQEIWVSIIKQSRFISLRTSRHMIYIGFVLTLTSILYCGGIVIACHKKNCAIELQAEKKLETIIFYRPRRYKYAILPQRELRPPPRFLKPQR